MATATQSLAASTTPNQSTAPCHCDCSGWRCWLDAWATPGGNIVMLSLLAGFFIMITVYLMVKFGPATPAVMFLVPIAGGFALAITTRMGINIDTSRQQNSRTTDHKVVLDADPNDPKP